jgi:hypothetical protein
MSNYSSHELSHPSLRPGPIFLPLDITAAVTNPSKPASTFRSSIDGQSMSKLRQYHEAKLSARNIAKEREHEQE